MPMSRSVDRIVVVDIESTCWDGATPEGKISEIIEVGACSIDVDRLLRGEKLDIFIEPIESEISLFCTRLTGITSDKIKEAGPVTFPEACRVLREYAGNDLWASYGDYDRTMFRSQCDRRGVEYPFGSRHLNVKTLAALIMGLSREVGMAAALNIAGLPLKGNHHSAVDDAWNIANLLIHCLEKARIGD